MDIRLTTLDPQPGEIILAHLPLQVTPQEIQGIAEIVTQTYPQNNLFMLPYGLDLEAVDADRMLEAGWVPVT